MPGNKIRNKGINGEREIILMLQIIVDNEYFNYPNLMAPKLERNQNQSVSGGYDLVGLNWVGIEVKRCEKIEIKKWFNQVTKACKKKEVPIILFRQNFKHWRVIGKSHENKPVEILLANFLDWFRLRIRNQIFREMENL